MQGTIYIGQAVDGLVRMKRDGIIVDTCVTSPPYYGLRDYGKPGQIGLEESPDEYIARLVDVFSRVRDVLADDGTLWVNIGDSYANVGKSGGSSGGKHVKALHGNTGIGRGKRDFGDLKGKDLIGIPWMLAFALRADGWYLRQDIVWSKPNPMPEGVQDRCTRAHEYIFMLSKSPRYYYDYEAVKQPVAASTVGRGPVSFGGAKGRAYGVSVSPSDPNFRNGSEQWGRTYDYAKSSEGGRNRRSVWEVATKPYKGAHFAVFPEELITPCILAGCPPGGVVLDPFMGSGTTAITAVQNGRNFAGCELNPAYVPLQRERLGLFASTTRWIEVSNQGGGGDVEASL